MLRGELDRIAARQLDVAHTDRVLGRECCHDGAAVGSERVARQQVGLRGGELLTRAVRRVGEE